MQNYVENMWCSLFKNTFCKNLVKKIKIVSLSRNLVARLIWIRWIQLWCSLFQFLTGHTFFGSEMGPKNQNCQFKLKIGIWLIRIWKFNSDVHFFSWSTGSILFLEICFNNQIDCWSWNLESRLIWINLNM